MDVPPDFEPTPHFEPAMSVVVVAGESYARVRSCLRSIVEQEGFANIELVLVDCGRPEHGDPFSQVLAAVPPQQLRVVRPPSTCHYGEALALGVHHSRAPIVAFLEEHARALPGWALALIETHRGPAAAVACEVHVANPGLGLSDGWGLMGYGKWYAPLAAGETDFVHGYNSACKREVLLGYGDQLGDLLLADTAFASKLRLDGYQLENCPAAKIEHLNEVDLILPLRKTFLSHRFSSSTRAKVCEWSWQRRLIYIVGQPLLPLYGLWCQSRAYRGRPRLLATLVRILPQFLLAHTAMALGAVFGLTLGPGRSAFEFTWLEINNHRPELS